MDGTIPRKNLAQVLARYRADGSEVRPALRQRVPRRRRQPASADPVRRQPARANWHRAEAFGAEILALCVAVGGTITGEHGVGIEKIDSMCVQFAPAELEAFYAVKRAFDPVRLLNPDKAIPTLHRCAEFGRMRVARRPAAVCPPAALLNGAPTLQTCHPRTIPRAHTGRRRRRGQRPAHPRRRHQGLVWPGPARRTVRHPRLPRASSITSRPSWWSPRAAARRWPRSRRHWRSTGQMLAFEPPHFGSTVGAGSTIGGVVASALSGPRRASSRRRARLRARRGAAGRTGRTANASAAR